VHAHRSTTVVVARAVRAVRAGGAGCDHRGSIACANAVPFGLTAGFYGSAEETERFFGSIEAGVTYPTGPRRDHGRAGFQPFAAGRLRIDRPAARSL